MEKNKKEKDAVLELAKTLTKEDLHKLLEYAKDMQKTHKKYPNR